MGRAEKLFLGCVSDLVFNAAEELSRSLQSRDTSAQKAHLVCKSVLQYYQKLRQDEFEFEHLYSETIKEAAAFNIEPTLPRHRNRPKRYDDGQDAHKFDSPKQLHKQEYIETLEFLINLLEARFDQNDFDIVCDTENMLLGAANGTSVEFLDSIKLYTKDIDMTKLKTHLKLLPQFIQVTNEDIKHVGSMRTIASALNSSQVGKKLLSEVTSLLQIYFTIPVTTATAERSFSILGRLKTWLRSTMSQGRLNNLLMSHAHEMADQAESTAESGASSHVGGNLSGRWHHRCLFVNLPSQIADKRGS
ncbi:uncharacterized protein LOC121370176 [Gigantopelta aegis]|uniref:uncharacterized protein LOC121370176 n=1 Tax=Gigantopelta aegis TaxID=1735272 RepID=UPI001B88DC31|nr:uncharacterized protein LOC121370176 [Gigantopelta aegis]